MGLLLSVISKLLSNEVNFSDKDSAIKLGAIIRIDFLVINFNAKILISYIKLTNKLIKYQCNEKYFLDSMRNSHY